MEQYLIPAGLLLNALIITVNRFVVKIPDWLYITGLIVGIGLIIAGAVMRR